MATLEKIRSKSVLLVSIIFVALFLFIITIIDNPLGIFMDNTTVVDVNGRKVSIEEYQKRAQEIRQQNPQNENAEAQALESLISNALFDQELEKLGIVVTNSEITELLVGENASPYLVNAFTGQFGAMPADVLAAINNPESMGLTDEQVAQLSAAYKEFEDQYVDRLVRNQKFLKLVGGTINANKLDARAAYDEGNTSYTLATVSKPVFSAEPDSVSDAEIQKYYEAHKASFKQSEPTRYIRYVDLPIVPSSADRQAAVNASQEAMALLAESEAPGLDALVGNSAFVIDRISGDEATVKNRRLGSLLALAQEGNIGETRVVLNGAFSDPQPRIVIARLMGRETKSNGATVKQAVIDPAQNADSVLARINNTPDSLAAVPGVVDVQETKFDFAQLPQQIVDDLRAADGKFINLTMNNGTIVATAITKYDDPKEIYTLQTATYEVEPSRQTINDLNTRMRDFMIVASRADAFNTENAVQYGLSVNDALVGNSSPGIGQLSDTRDIVGWAMEDAKKGEVSRLFIDNKNSHMTVAALVDIYKSDYIPASFPPLHDQLRDQALNEKLTAKLIEEYKGKGKSLADYQAVMKAPRIDTLTNINIIRPANGSAGYSQLGGIRGAKKGDLVGPVEMGRTVMVYQVLDAKEGEMPFDEVSNSMQFSNMMQNYIVNNPEGLILGNGKINNRILKFNR